MKVFKGSIITCDEYNTIAKYLVEDNGRIVYIGNELPDLYKKTKKVHLGKRALLPSFADTHIHFASFAVFHAGLNIVNVRSNQQILELLSRCADRNLDKILIAFGASAHSVEEKRLLVRQQLDDVCGVRPVMLVREDGHACIVNTILLERVRSQIETLRGFHEESGQMQQEAFLAILDYVTTNISTFTLLSNMKKAIDYIASKGIGMIHTAGGIGVFSKMDVNLERLMARGLSNGFLMRTSIQKIDENKIDEKKINEKKLDKRGRKHPGACFAIALDGCYDSRNSALRNPYEEEETNGILLYTDEQVIEYCKRANRANLRIELHAIGDAAFHQAAKALKEALEDYPRTDHRHGIIHACLPDQEGLEICRKYGIRLVVQTAYMNWTQGPDRYVREILGERSKRLLPLHTFLNYSLELSFGSDAPCTDPDPILWIHNACNHSIKEESVSVYEALRMCTFNGYAATFDETDRGSLEIGKIADMTILSDNPYRVETDCIKDIKVERLYLNGKKYKRVKQSTIPLIMKGALSFRKK